MSRIFSFPALRLTTPGAGLSGRLAMWLARVPHWLPVLLLALFAWQAAHWSWIFFTPRPAAAPNAAVAVTNSTLDVQGILAATLFGVAEQTRLVTHVDSSIELRGVFDSIGSMPAFAILLVDGVQQVIREGAEIAPGATLVAVRAKAVRIRRNGQDEIISFADQATQASTARSNNMPLHLSRAFLENSLRDPGQWVSAGQLAMHPGGGLRVQSVKTGGLYQQLGLQGGDVLQMLNGQNIGNPDQAFSLFRAALDSGNIQLSLIRVGQVQQFNYRIE